MVKFAVVLPAATVTDDGVPSLLLLSDSDTTIPPDGAGPESVTVPVAPFPPLKDCGLTVRSVSTGRLIVNDGVKFVPLKLPVIVTDVLLETALVVIVAVPVVCPAAIVNVTGT